MLSWRRMNNFRKLAQLEIPKNWGELYNELNIAKSKNWKTEKIQEIFRNSKKQKIELQGMLLWRHMQNFRKLAQLEIPKNRGEHKCRTKILIIILMTKIWTQYRKYDKVITFEHDRISTRSKRRFVHLGKVIHGTNYYKSEATICCQGRTMKSRASSTEPLSK